MFEWHTDKAIQTYLHIGPFNQEYDFRLFYVKAINRGQKVYVARLNSSPIDEIICCCRIVGDSFIWMCNPKYRGNGYTAEMLSALLKELSLYQAVARIDSRNIASQRVAEKTGFVRSPIRQFSDNKIIYEYIYQK